MRVLLSCLWLLFLLPGCAGPVKRALKALEKTKYEKAERILDRRVEKDSLNPGAYYVYSLLFSQGDYPAYNIDSAHFYIMKALDQYPAAGKKVKKLQRQDINDSLFRVQKARVDSLGFARALEKNTLQAYQYFIDRFPAARQVPEAKEIRNDIAYQKARTVNTYEAYKGFLDTYPNAKQISEANEMYEFLLYENKTRDRKLSSYVRFLKEHPHTNYTGNAQKNIFEISTAAGRQEDYVRFIQTYPDNRYRKRAIDFLYHIFKGRGEPLDFFRTYSKLKTGDSLQQIAALESEVLLPVYEGEKYGFINQEGEMIIPPVYNTISTDYFCGNIQADYLVTGENTTQQVIARNNRVVLTGPFASVEDLGYGMLRVSRGDSVGLYHKSGYRILDTEYERIVLMDHQYIKFRQQGKWGMKTFTGKDLLEASYDDIYREGDFLIVEKYGLLAVTSDKAMTERTNGAPVSLKFRYDDAAQVDDVHLLAFYKDQEAVLDTALQVIIPLDEHHLGILKEGWLIYNGRSYFLYNEGFVPYTHATLDTALFNDHWLALKRAGRWTLLEQEGNLFPDFRYDSVRLLSNGIALTFSRDSTMAHFAGGEAVLLPAGVSVRLLNFSPGQNAGDYLITENRNGYKQVYDLRGRQIISGAYHTIAAVGPGLISLERYGKKGLADTTGQMVLPIRYSGIGNYEQGNVALLKNGKFGLYNGRRDILIPPQYDITLRPYGEKFFIASKNDKLGLIDARNKTVAPFQFDDIRKWSDSLALVKQGREWSIYNYDERQVQYGPFIDFKYVRNRDDEQILIILDESRYGVLSSRKGVVLPPDYNDLLNLGSPEYPVYYTEKKVEEAIFFIITYYDRYGRKIREQAMANDDYDLIYCE